MKLFVTVLHKQNAISNELYSVSFSDYKNIFDNVFKYELKTQTAPSDLTRKLLIYTFIANSYDKPLRTYKYKCIQDIFNNQFILQESKEHFLSAFGKAYRVCTTLNRFIYRWKLARAVPRNDSDLFMNPICESDKNVITIFQNEQKFLFSISDIISLVENALCNMDCYDSSPKIAKNPYNNMAFNKSILCNIYFFLCKRCIKVPQLIQQYFYSGLNLTLFRHQNEFLIRDVYVEKYIKNCDNNIFVKNITQMLKDVHYSGKIVIDKEFPIEKLKKIMYPYVELYIKYLYAFSTELSNYYFREIKKKICFLYNFNPNFGKKKIDKTTKVAYICDKHPIFTPFSYFENFQKSHLEYSDFSNSVLSNESDSDSEDYDEQSVS